MSIVLEHILRCWWCDSRGSRGLFAYAIFLDRIKGYILLKLSGFGLWRVGEETNHLHYIVSPFYPFSADTALNGIIW